MSKIIQKSLIVFAALMLSATVSTLALADVSTNALANASFSDKCLFHYSDVFALGEIIRKNTCGTELTDKRKIAQCSRVALTQYTVCQYKSLLNDIPVSNNAPDYQVKTSEDSVEATNYTPNITSSSNNDDKKTNRKVFNWF
jgi:hypothetical protein